MGFFGMKKKSPSVSSKQLDPTWPAASSSFHSPPPAPTARPQTHLRVSIDPIRPNANDDGLFTIAIDSDAEVSEIRKVISHRLGQKCLNVFKVCIPVAARQEAQTYTRQYQTSVDLITCFPAFNLNDPQQFPSRVDPAGWSPRPDGVDPSRVKDWFAVSSSSHAISVVVRMVEDGPSDVIPLTLLAHFAPSEQANISLCPRSSLKRVQPLPTAVDVLPSTSVSGLKHAVLEADSRSDSVQQLDKVIVWQVEMSEDEMIVIGERGGLKNGRMPWPYPPTAPVPVSLCDSKLPISAYFRNELSDVRMINISVWVDPSLRPSGKTGDVRPFSYPLINPIERKKSVEQPVDCLGPATTRRTRQRPSTAPTILVTTPSGSLGAPQPHAFGSRAKDRRAAPSLRSVPRIRTASPLATSAFTPDTSEITSAALPAALPGARGSVSDSDEEGAPSLTFSQLSLVIEPSENEGDRNLRTPDAEQKEWNPVKVDDTGDLKKVPGFRLTSLRNPFGRGSRLEL